MTTRSYIIILVSCACVLLAYLFVFQSSIAIPASAAIAFAVTAFAGIITKQGEIEAKVVTAVEKVDENTAKTQQIHVIVNQQRTDMMKQIERLDTKVAALEQEKAVTAAEQKSIDANRPGLSE